MREVSSSGFLTSGPFARMCTTMSTPPSPSTARREPADREVAVVAVAPALAQLGRHVLEPVVLGVERIDLRERQLAAAGQRSDVVELAALEHGLEDAERGRPGRRPRPSRRPRRAPWRSRSRSRRRRRRRRPARACRSDRSRAWRCHRAEGAGQRRPRSTRSRGRARRRAARPVLSALRSHMHRGAGVRCVTCIADRHCPSPWMISTEASAQPAQCTPAAADAARPRRRRRSRPPAASSMRSAGRSVARRSAIEGATPAATTDADGRFTIEAPARRDAGDQLGSPRPRARQRHRARARRHRPAARRSARARRSRSRGEAPTPAAGAAAARSRGASSGCPAPAATSCAR